MKDHCQDVEAFKREANGGKNEEIKWFASNTLPTLEEHLRMAEKAEHAVLGSNGAIREKPASDERDVLPVVDWMVPANLSAGIAKSVPR